MMAARVLPTTLVLGVLFGASAPVTGAEIVTDRPDFTESATVVPLGSVQLEGGFSRIEDAGGETSWVAPELLVRWGISERLELRFALPDYLDIDQGARSIAGVGDGSVGAKFQLGPVRSGWDIALIAELSVPVGDRDLSSDEVDPSALLAFGRDFEGGWSLGTQLSWSASTVGSGTESTVGGTVVVGRPLAADTGLFIELSAEDAPAGRSSLLLHHGYTWSPAAHWQLDIHLAVGIDGDAPDSLIGAGISYRID